MIVGGDFFGRSWIAERRSVKVCPLCSWRKAGWWVISRHFAVHCPVHKVRWKVIGGDVADNEVLVAEA